MFWGPAQGEGFKFDNNPYQAHTTSQIACVALAKHTVVTVGVLGRYRTMRDAAQMLSIGAVLLALFLWPISTCVVVLSMIGLLVFQANRPAMRRQVQRHNALPGAQLTQAPYSPTDMVAYPSSPTLHERIIHQVHYYFSAENLCRDEFLRGHMDPREGWVPIQLIASFNRLRSLTKDVNLVVEALRLSPELEVRNGMVRKRHDSQRWLLPQAQLGGPIIQRVEERVHLPRRSSRSPVRQQREPPTTHQVLGTTHQVLGGPTSPTPLSSRAFVPVPSLCATGAVPAADARLVSYNILADEHCMEVKHAYCPVKDREWLGDSGRGARLVAELLSYEADIVCLQECSLQKFDDCFRPGLGQKYTGFHHSKHLTSHAAEKARTHHTGQAIFVRSRRRGSPSRCKLCA